MRIAITGSTGLIGSALSTALTEDGHEVVRLVRHTHPDEAAGERHWSPFGDPDPKPYEGCDVVVHLAGAGLGDKRWSAAYKREVRESRVHGTDTLARSLAQLTERPKALLSASAIGYYGDTGTATATEDSPGSEDFLGALCRDWEAATKPAEDAGIPVAHLRSGVVLGGSGGALARMLPFFKAGIGGPIGSGRQYFSFIGMADYLAAVRHVMTPTADGTMTGAVNMTGPLPVTNRAFTKALGHVLHRPTIMPVPGFALRVLFGQMANELTGSQRVLPARLTESGFTFTTPDARSALAAAVA
ncbi:TIGR01777 family oxidoreductase [Catenulispora pinisilvae]|uniref:TIGR01777 family oxidoreductase n=1 Tax=Catenulispora pinisilvae TaxID=2705253 RepID=UPI0018926B12|nr:TIGR01777 family oxidoreductase [Catenulispora pinisilvae]